MGFRALPFFGAKEERNDGERVIGVLDFRGEGAEPGGEMRAANLDFFWEEKRTVSFDFFGEEERVIFRREETKNREGDDDSGSWGFF